MSKRRVIVSMRDLSPQVRTEMHRQYPFGFEGRTIRVPAPTPFNALVVETDEVCYLVKMGSEKEQLDFREDDFELSEAIVEKEPEGIKEELALEEEEEEKEVLEKEAESEEELD